MLRARSLFGVLAAAIVWWHAASRSGAQDARAQLDALLARLSKIEALTAHFREEKRMALLAVPLVSEGTLYYQKPRLLARHTEKPKQASLVLRDDKLWFGDAQHSESMALDAQPSVRVLVDTFVSVLAGDRAELEKLSTVELTPRGDNGFRIQVVPKDPKVRRIVRSMAFEGTLDALSRMELVDQNGDTTVTTFSQVRFSKRYDAKQAARIFRIGG